MTIRSRRICWAIFLSALPVLLGGVGWAATEGARYVQEIRSDVDHLQQKEVEIDEWRRWVKEALIRIETNTNKLSKGQTR